MIRWIENSKGAPNNKSTGLKGITIHKGEYRSRVTVTSYNKKGERIPITLLVGYYKTLKEAKKARVDYIIGLL